MSNPCINNIDDHVKAYLRQKHTFVFLKVQLFFSLCSFGMIQVPILDVHSLNIPGYQSTASPPSQRLVIMLPTSVQVSR